MFVVDISPKKRLKQAKTKEIEENLLYAAMMEQSDDVTVSFTGCNVGTCV